MTPAAKLLEKLQDEADLAFERNWEVRNQEVVRRNTRQPPTKEEQKRARLFRLRKETSEILDAMELDKQVETESRRYVEARLRQRKANLTVAEKKAQAEETRRGQIQFSRVIAENHPDWREHASEAFRNKKL
jgi:hypothetical protein